MSTQPNVKDFFDPKTNTFSYVVSDPATKQCAIIDSVLDYDSASAVTSTTHADQIIAYVKEQGLQVEWILETHVHADHLTAAQYLKQQLGGKTAMSERISLVQDTFSSIYNIDIKQFNAYQTFDHVFQDHEEFHIGNLKAYNIPTPGHTPACLSYVIGDAVFVIPCLCLIMERHDVIFRRAVLRLYLILCRPSISCLKTLVFSYVMTIYRNHVMTTSVKRISKLRNSLIFIFILAQKKRSLLQCAKNVMQP